MEWCAGLMPPETGLERKAGKRTKGGSSRALINESSESNLCVEAA